jgi:hypothetical protein
MADAIKDKTSVLLVSLEAASKFTVSDHFRGRGVLGEVGRLVRVRQHGQWDSKWRGSSHGSSWWEKMRCGVSFGRNLSNVFFFFGRAGLAVMTAGNSRGFVLKPPRAAYFVLTRCSVLLCMKFLGIAWLVLAAAVWWTHAAPLTFDTPRTTVTFFDEPSWVMVAKPKVHYACHLIRLFRSEARWRANSMTT